jgi:hypothetical protein
MAVSKWESKSLLAEIGVFIYRFQQKRSYAFELAERVSTKHRLIFEGGEVDFEIRRWLREWLHQHWHRKIFRRRWSSPTTLLDTSIYKDC